jgi:RNA polymerase sigma factor (sigma-70 family)
LQDEQQLLEELLNPDTREIAYTKLVQLYSRPLYNHIRTLVLNHDDADDVLQNTFIKVYRHLHTFKGESKLFSWMYRIATNEAFTFLRQAAKQRRFSTAELQDYAIGQLKADTFFDGDELEIKLQKAVSLLPDKQKLVFKMKYFQDLKYEEISEIVGTSVGALKASFHHAVKKIEDYMKRD